MILDQAVAIASEVGFTGLTIGQLAEHTGLSKSGLFAHFKSKEALQLETFQWARERFDDVVIRPTLAAPAVSRGSGACSIGGSTGRPEPCRAAVSSSPRRSSSTTSQERRGTPWCESSRTGRSSLRRSCADGGDRGRLPRGARHRAAGVHVQGLMLGYHHAARLMHDPKALEHTRQALDQLLDASAAVAPILREKETPMSSLPKSTIVRSKNHSCGPASGTPSTWHHGGPAGRPATSGSRRRRGWRTSAARRGCAVRGRGAGSRDPRAGLGRVGFPDGHLMHGRGGRQLSSLRWWTRSWRPAIAWVMFDAPAHGDSYDGPVGAGLTHGVESPRRWTPSSACSDRARLLLPTRWGTHLVLPGAA